MLLEVYGYDRHPTNDLFPLFYGTRHTPSCVLHCDLHQLVHHCASAISFGSCSRCSLELRSSPRFHRQVCHIMHHRVVRPWPMIASNYTVRGLARGVLPLAAMAAVTQAAAICTSVTPSQQAIESHHNTMKVLCAEGRAATTRIALN